MATFSHLTPAASPLCLRFEVTALGLHHAHPYRIQCTWQVEDCDNGNVILKNLQNGTYLSCEGEPRVNKLIVGADEPREWRLQKSSESSTFQ